MAKIIFSRQATESLHIEAGTFSQEGEVNDTTLFAWAAFQNALKEKGIIIEDFKVELVSVSDQSTNEEIGVNRGPIDGGKLDEAFQEIVLPNWVIFLDKVNSVGYFFKEGQMSIKIVDIQ